MESRQGTPLAPRESMSQNPGYYKGGTNSFRDSVCTYIEEIPEVDLSVFLNHYIPPRTVAATPKTIAKALSQEWRYPSRPFQTLADVPTFGAPLDVKNSRWATFSVDPKAQEKKESAVYSGFENIFDQIVAYCLEMEPNLRQTTKYFNEGDRGAQSTKVSRPRRDADIRLRWPGDLFDGRALYTHAVTIQLKKAEKDYLQNSRQLNWELLHTLRSEPGRRFVLGMTVENRNVRLWHFNREIVVVSKAFDFQSDYETFIDILARFAFASPSQLGYDPTFIKGAPLGGGKRRNDKIVINDTVYELLQVIEIHRANAAMGRCSWLWDAKNTSTAETIVIKDCWMEDDRPTEYEILEDMRKRIRAYDWKRGCVPPSKGARWAPLSECDPGRVDPHYHDDINRIAYFVNIMYGEKVKVDDMEDNTRTVMARGHALPPDPLSWEVFRIAPQARERQVSGHTSGTMGHESQDASEYAPVAGIFAKGTNARAHHRIVMSRGEPLDKINDSVAAFRVLKDASYGLFVMHCIGYLHRDPSAPNILLSHDGLGVLSDIEYAKRLEDMHPVHIGMTGTANYVAIEAIVGDYILANKPDKPRAPLARYPDGRPIPSAVPTNVAVSASRDPWKLCELHDIESMFWIALWILYRHTLSRYTSTTKPPYDIIAHRKLYQEIFPGQWNKSDMRRRMLCVGNRYDAALNALPPEFRFTAFCFGAFRETLVEHYEKVGERRIHGGLWNMLHGLCADAMDLMPQNVTLVPLSTLLPRGEKRHADGDVVDATNEGWGQGEGPSNCKRKGS
ncbi:hypothetical protein HDZ31DRAFT_32840 [Schizophyllum fasciatum]